MGREQFSAPEESTREKRRKSTLQVEYALLGAFLGALIGTADIPGSAMGILAILLTSLPFLTNRYWDEIYSKFPR